MDFTLYWFMFPVSIVVATCAMLSGIGGAALFTPIFILVFPLLGPEYVLNSTIAAISAALITQTFGFFSGFIGYYRRHLIDYALGRYQPSVWPNERSPWHTPVFAGHFEKLSTIEKNPGT